MQTFHKLTLPKLFGGVFFFLLLSTTSVFGQSTVTGQVFDEFDRALAGANIVIKGTNEGTYCDENGFFQLNTPRDFPFEIEVSFVGYATEVLSISSPPENLVIQLITVQGNEMVVSVSRIQERAQIAPAAVNVIRERTLKSDAVTEPMFSLRNLPGVDISQYGVSGGQINLRGKSETFQTETFIIADYRNIVIPSLGFLAFGQHPIDMIDLERIEVVKGPGSALYGPGVEAGVVHFISKDPFKHEGNTVSLGVGNRKQFVSSFRHAKIINDKFAYKITGQYRSARDFELDPNDPVHAARLASFKTPIVSALTGEIIDAIVPDYDQRSYGFTGTLVYKPNEKTTLTTVGGYGIAKGLFRTSQGESFADTGRPFAQVRLNSGGLFAQTFWSKSNGKDGNVILYNTGLTNINIVDQLESQLQYNLPLNDGKLDLTLGGDFRLVSIDTKGTGHGRFEEDDNYTILGFYSQGKYSVSQKWDVVAAARVDRFSVLDETAISPRMGLIFKPSSSNTFRLTWNRAYGAPTSLNLFADTPIADNGAFLVYLLNGVENLTFDQGNGYNFITSETTPQGNIPLADLYGLVTSGLASSGSFPQGLTDYMFSLIPNVDGTTAAVPTSTPITRTPLSLSESDMFEIGYKGMIDSKWVLSADLYYSRRKNILSAPLPISPFLVYPAAGPDLASTVITYANPDVLATYGFTPESLASIYSTSIEGFTLDENGEPTALGILSSDNSPTNVGTYDFAYLNFDKLEYWGLDLGVEYFLNNDFSIFANLTWLSRNYWEELTLNDSNLTAPFSLNVPDKRFKLGLNFYPENGFFYNAALRITSDWESVNGINFSGPVDGYFVVDAGVGYKFDNLQLSISATNLFNEKYRAIYGAPDIRRLVLAKVIYEFK